jgi:hypothetical protein
MDKPGIDEQEFIINFGNEISLIIGEDIEIISEPEPCEDGYKWTFKCISNKSFKYFYDIYRQ